MRKIIDRQYITHCNTTTLPEEVSAMATVHLTQFCHGILKIGKWTGKQMDRDAYHNISHL